MITSVKADKARAVVSIGYMQLSDNRGLGLVVVTANDLPYNE